MEELQITKLPSGETVLTYRLDGTNADGSPREIVVTLPPGQKLDAVTANEIFEHLCRVAVRHAPGLA